MQILEIDWKQFLDQLPSFQRLGREARRLFLEKVRPSQPISNADLGEYSEVLLAAGFLLSGPKGRNAVVPPQYRVFCRVMRSLYRHRIFDSPSPQTFNLYLSEHFTRSEQSAFTRLAGDYYYYGGRRLYSQVSSVEWLKRFLEASTAEPEEEYAFGGRPRTDFTDEVLGVTKELVRRLMSLPSPVPLAEARGLCPQVSPDLLIRSLRAGIRNLLCFPGLRGEDLEPVLGIWPQITARLFRTTPKPPQAVTPRQVFDAPFLMDDVASILATCAVDPFRVRGHDYGLFARTAKALAASFGTLPEWFELDFGVTTPERINQALSLAHQFEFLGQKGDPGEDLRLEVTEAGRHWLGKPAKGRLKTLLDGLLGRHRKRTEMLDYDEEVASLLPYPVEISDKKQSEAVQACLLSCFVGSGTEAFVSVREFLAYHRERNPLISAVSKRPVPVVRIRGAYVTTPNEDELEEVWTGLLWDFLRLRLLPLGGARAGLNDAADVCFAVTGVGRYLVGAQADFDLQHTQARIVVQPNFDVVFLAAAPQAESEIARFTDRKGRHTGTLFTITKRSIFAAAAAGLAADQALETLRLYCAGEVPANVEHEISGWFAQCRQISVRPAMLIHCPDEDTAARVLAIVGVKASRITDTTLELHEHNRKTRASLLRRLREKGIFART